jgi:hypothetical protein
MTTRLLPGTYHFTLKSESGALRKPLVVRVGKAREQRYFVKLN